MRFLIDQNRSPRLAGLLRDSGHDAVHTLEVGLEEAEDDELLLLAAEHQRVVVSGDTDFGALLALAHRRTPSVILFRARHLPRAEEPVPREVSLLLEFVRDSEQAWHDDDVELGERGEPLEGVVRRYMSADTLAKARLHAIDGHAEEVAEHTLTQVS